MTDLAIPAAVGTNSKSNVRLRAWKTSCSSPRSRKVDAEDRERSCPLDHSPALLELQDVLRQEWADFSTTLEDRMQEHFQRQEVLMNQQAIRIEGIRQAVSQQKLENTACSSKANTEDGAADSQSFGGSPAKDMSMNPRAAAVAALAARAVDGNGDDGILHPKPNNVHLVAAPSPCRRPEGAPVTERPVDVNNGNPTDIECYHLSVHSEVEKEPHPWWMGSWTKGSTTASQGPEGHSSSKENCHRHPTEIFDDDLLTQSKGDQKEAMDTINDIINEWVEWWVELEEPPRRGCLPSFIDGRKFELLSAIVVVANSIVTVYTTNREAISLSDVQPAPIKMVNFAFIVYYTIEIILKLWVHRIYFFFNGDMSWNLFDLGLVVLAFNDILLSQVIDTKSVDMSAMRTIRILRIAKILRVVRVMRFFPELRLILNSVLGSVVSLFWSIVMLTLMFFIFALVFVQGATTVRMHDNDIKPDDMEQLELSLGTVQAGMLTLYQTTTGGDDWMTFYRAIRHTGELNCFLFLFFIAFAQFALLNILTGIFVENAMKLAQPDRDTLALQKRKQEVSEANELRRLCESMDTENTGFISADHFKAHLESEQFKARLAMLGLDIKDAELFFGVVSDFGTNQVEVESFVTGAMRLKGLASALDLQTLTFGTKLIHANQMKFHKAVEDRFNHILSLLQ